LEGGAVIRKERGVEKTKALFTLIAACLAVFLLPQPDAVFADSFTEDIQVFAKDNPQGFIEFCRSVVVFYQQKQDLDRALSWAERICRMQPNNLQMHYLKAELNFNLGNFEDCEMTLEALERNPSFQNNPLLVSVRQLLYKSYHSSGKLRQKQKQLSEELKVKQADIDTYRRLLMMYRTSESFKQVIKVAKQAIQAYPDESSFRMALAYAYQQKGKIKEAIAEYKALIERQPQHATAYNLLFDMVRQEKAALRRGYSLWQEFVQAAPENALRRMHLADILYALDNKNEALNEYKLALERAPDNLPLLFRIVSLEIELKLYDQAEVKLDMLEHRFGVNPVIFDQVKRYREEIYKKQGNKFP
jgi:tetratricopeptide (TPR) repeat protein